MGTVVTELRVRRQAAERAKKVEAAKAKYEEKKAEDKGEEKKAEEKEKQEGDEAEGESAKEAPKESEKKEEVVEETLEEEIKKAEAAIELSDREKSISFKKADVPDIDSKEFSKIFSTFTIPEKSEGFDEIRYVWQKAPACEEYLKKWIVERKLTERVEDLQPGQWFKEQWA